jgi:hypothetical protein
MTPEAGSRPAPAWAKNAGHIVLQALRHFHRTDEGIERVLIAERIYRYGWTYDERDPSLLGDCFTEDGVWEANIMGLKPLGPFSGRQTIVDFLTDFWKFQTDQRRHMFTNIIVDSLTGIDAVAHAYLLLTASTDATMTPVTVGPYRFQMEKQKDSWRIKHLFGGFDAPF